MSDTERYASIIDSPFGELTLVATHAGLQLVKWASDDSGRHPVSEKWLALSIHPVLTAATDQLAQYFAGHRIRFDLPLDLQGTDFQKLAWLALADVPFGTTTAYAEQAKRVGRPRAVRAVGAANGSNPVSIILPCHRVIASDGALTGYSGGIEVKRALLEFERDIISRQIP